MNIDGGLAILGLVIFYECSYIDSDHCYMFSSIEANGEKRFKEMKIIVSVLSSALVHLSLEI